jgi:hypothetical protein
MLPDAAAHTLLRLPLQVDDGIGMIHTVAHDGMHAVAWAIRSLLHELTDNSVDRDMAAKEMRAHVKEGGVARG